MTIHELASGDLTLLADDGDGLRLAVRAGDEPVAAAADPLVFVAEPPGGPVARSSFRPTGADGDGAGLRVTGELVAGAARWSAVVTVTPVECGFRVAVEAELAEGAADGSFELSAEPAGDPGDTWHLVPGVLYGTNRPDAVVAKGYPPVLSVEEMRELGLDAQARQVTLDLPRLAPETGWTVDLQTLDTTSARAVGWHRPPARTWEVATPFVTGLGPSGLRLVAEPGGAHRVTVTVPAQRPRRYQGWAWGPRPDAPVRFAAGDRVEFESTLVVGEAGSIADVLAGQHARAGRGLGDADVPPTLPLSAAVELIERKYTSLAWREEPGYFRTHIPAGDDFEASMNFEEGASLDPVSHLQLGWVSGLSTVFGLLGVGSAETRRRALKELRFILAEGQCDTGLYRGLYDGARWWPTHPWTDTRIDFQASGARRTTDTVRWGLKLLPLLRGAVGEPTLADELAASVRRACEALVRLWDTEGDIGYLIDPHTARILWRGSTSGALAIENLVHAAAVFDWPDALRAAREIAAAYHERHIARGVCYGSCQDILNSTDQEGCADLVAGFVALYDATGEPEHLAWAREAADLLDTWCLRENVSFPPGSLFDRLGIRPRGAMTASVQNLVGTPGLCVDSGAALLRLAEQTEEWRYAALLRDIVRVCPQMVVRDPADWEGRLPAGSMTECLNVNDALTDRGGAYLADCGWAQDALMAVWAEVPGVYVDVAERRVVAFDHVTAELAGDHVRIANPTAVDAVVRVRERGSDVATEVAVPAGGATDVVVGAGVSAVAAGE